MEGGKRGSGMRARGNASKKEESCFDLSKNRKPSLG